MPLPEECVAPKTVEDLSPNAGDGISIEASEHACVVSVAPDGSPVALYLALPGEDEARLIHEAIPASAHVLELGCGVGRITRPLAALGHAITAVDNSHEMLAMFPSLAGVETILDDIGTLDLGRRFRAVVLVSHMINSDDGAALLRAAARHVTDDGVVLVERHEPGWVDAAAPTVTERHGVSFELADVSHPEAGAVAATAVYTVAAVIYRQRFVAYEVDDERLTDLAGQVGLRIAGYAEDDPAWVKLTPI
jgi:SAM-dependent methyltransferase